MWGGVLFFQTKSNFKSSVELIWQHDCMITQTYHVGFPLWYRRKDFPDGKRVELASWVALLTLRCMTPGIFNQWVPKCQTIRLIKHNHEARFLAKIMGTQQYSWRDTSSHLDEVTRSNTCTRSTRKENSFCIQLCARLTESPHTLFPSSESSVTTYTCA